MNSSLLKLMQQRVVFLDGAMGTMIHTYELPVSDYENLENCSEILNVSRPDVIQQIHESFLDAGADIIETNTFGGMLHVLKDFGIEDRLVEINQAAVGLARAAVAKFSTPKSPRFILGSMGPGTKLITLEQITRDEMFASYFEQAKVLGAGGSGVGVDGYLIETCQDLLQIKIAIDAVVQAQQALTFWGTDKQLPIFISVTVEQTGTLLLGSDIAAALAALAPLPIEMIGLNCATGPVEMTSHVQYLGTHFPRKISAFPNAGLPSLVDGETVFPLGPDEMATQVKALVERTGANMIGGCCGSTPEHIRAIVQRIGKRAPAEREIKLLPSVTSLYQAVEYRQDSSLLNIGERCNASGSRKFKQLLEQEKWDDIVSLARDQLADGSHVIDINVDYAGRDNASDMARVVKMMVSQVNAPLMLDSTQAKTIEAGLKVSGGKCIINSANLEEGEEKFAQMCQLAKRYGAGLVLGTIDEDPQEAMARTADRKIAIATRMFDLATTKYGLSPSDIMFDPLVLPISTGMDKDRRSALETIEGTRRIVKQLPECQITCGLSNVSFGLKPAARQVLNSAFLYELTQAGMTSAIVHVSKILPRTRVDDQLWQAALDLIYDRRAKTPQKLVDGTLTTDPLQIFIDMFQDDATVQSMKKDIATLPLEERLQKHIIDGEKKKLVETLDLAREKYTPLEIVNDHLLEGMKVVGELFGSGQMQLPFVLQSAEVMKMAVTHLEQFMEKKEGETKGTIVLATVRGDVHDIGKNLVDIILTNNGYKVHNIGIKQPLHNILEALEKTKADVIGLSGLLVKSVNVMEENLREMVQRKISVPVLLGGAALSRHYCESYLRPIYNETQGNIYHGKDAFEGLRIMEMLKDHREDELNHEIESRLTKREQAAKKAAASAASNDKAADGATQTLPTRSAVALDAPIPTPPFWGSKVITDIALENIYPYINRVALYRGQWMFKKASMSGDAYQQLIKETVDPIFDRLALQCQAEKILTPQLVYGYFPCQSDGDDLIIFDPENHDKEIERFTFPRQQTAKRLCISDFYRSIQSGEKDVIAMHCVTVGTEASKRARILFEGDNYQEYLYLHGFGVEAAEAVAEYWHAQMRDELSIASDDDANIRRLFTQHYQGSRYSFGYPACPEMADQEKLFRLLDPTRIGCQLTENFEIDPEQSTSAIMAHHREARYFNVS